MKKIITLILKKKFDLILVVVALTIGIYFKWELLDLFFFLLFIWIIMNPIQSRYPASGALVLLVICPFLLIFKKNDLAEQSAVYAYYFLIFTVIMAFYELKKEDKTS